MNKKTRLKRRELKWRNRYPNEKSVPMIGPITGWDLYLISKYQVSDKDMKT